eukprot:1331894-Pyramimonas_sp.AAC.1
MRRALAIKNGYCVQRPIRLPLEGLAPPTCLPPPGLERTTAEVVLDYLVPRDSPVAKTSVRRWTCRVHVDRGDASLRMKRYCFK